MILALFSIAWTLRRDRTRGKLGLCTHQAVNDVDTTVKQVAIKLLSARVADRIDLVLLTKRPA
jgi:hypothetical protein